MRRRCDFSMGLIGKLLMLLMCPWVVQVQAQLPQQDPADDPLSPDINQIVQVPLSPEAAAFEKYGKVPVSMYTGSPNISVPLGAIQGSETAVPVSLTFDASGIRVTQIATWAGLGVNLNVGGVVTRQVNGLPDGDGDPNLGFFDADMESFINYVKDNDLNSDIPMPLDEIEHYFDVQRSQPWRGVDMQPDLFSFSVNGMSGTIYINYGTEEAYCVDNPNLKIEISWNNNTPGRIDAWTITGEDGTQYQFSEKETTWHFFEDSGNREHDTFYISAWFLSNITSPSGKDYILFDYEVDNTWVNKQDIRYYASGDNTTPANHGPIISSGPACAKSSPSVNFPGINEYYIQQSYLTDIYLNGNRAAAFRTDDQDTRADLEGRKRIQTIEFFANPSGGLVSRKVEFNHSYFGGFDHPIVPAPSPFPLESQVRLKLDGITISSPGGGPDEQQVYNFEYIDPNNIPDRNSLGVDFWGYYNGEDLNESLIPRLPELTFDDGTVIPGANRNPSLTDAQIGTIKKITYPTGGHTEFFYKLHSLPPNSGLIYETEVEEIIEFQGGILTGGPDPYEYNDDAFGLTTGQYPAGDDGVFILRDDEKPAKLRIELIGIPQSTNATNQYLGIYRSGTGNCVVTPLGELCDVGQKKKYPEITDPNNPNYIAPEISTDPVVNGNVWEIDLDNWDQAAYRILALNIDPGITMRVTFYKSIPVPQTIPQEVGGLRTYKVVDKDSDGTDLLTTYYYYDDLNKVNPASLAVNQLSNLLENSNTSSAISHQPLSFHDLSFRESCDGHTSYYTCASVNRYSSNRYNPVGPHIAYSAVTQVEFGPTAGMNGYTVNHYYNEAEFNRDIPLVKTKLANGELRLTQVYDANDNLLEQVENLVSVTSVNPVPSPSLIKSSTGLVLRSTKSYKGIRFKQDLGNGIGKFGYLEFCEIGPLPGTPAFCGDPGVSCVLGTFSINEAVYYAYSSHWLSRDKTIRTQYQDGIPVVTETEYFYENDIHRQLTETKTQNSDGTFSRLITYYPDDITNLNIATLFDINERPLIYQLTKNELHRINTPIYVERFYGNDRVFVQKNTFEDYSSIQNGPTTLNILPKKVYTAKGDPNEFQEVIVFEDYDFRGNPIDISRGVGPHQAFIWGYNRSLPITRIVNAEHAEVAYTSFEEDFSNTGNWTFNLNRINTLSASGTYAHELGGNPLSTFLKNPSTTNEASFLVSYWKQGGPATVTNSTGPDYSEVNGSWTYYHHIINVPPSPLNPPNPAPSGISVTISGSGLIDEVRSHPLDAQMTTYCYDGKGRLISTKDVNSRSTLYNYDMLNRLTRVFDHNQDLRQEIIYNYGNN